MSKIPKGISYNLITSYNIYQACKVEDVVTMNKIIGQNVTFRTYGFRHACYLGRMDIVKYMLTRGVHKNNYPEGLSSACYGGQIDIVMYLAKHCYRFDFDYGLYNACVKNHLHIVKYIIGECRNNIMCLDDLVLATIADVSGVVSLEILQYMVDFLMRKTRITNYPRHNKWLLSACSFGNLRVVKYLVEKFDINDVDKLNAGLDYAAFADHLDIVKYLLEQGANNFSSLYNAACRNAYSDIMTYLIEQNIAVDTRIIQDVNKKCDLKLIKQLMKNITEYNQTDVDVGFVNACTNGNLELVKYIIELKTNEIDLGVNTACDADRCDYVKYMMKCKRKNKQYLSYEEYARCNEHLYVVKCLLELNAMIPDNLHTKQIQGLLNIGLSADLLQDKADKYIITRNERIKIVENTLLSNNVICKDVSNLICSYIEY